VSRDQKEIVRVTLKPDDGQDEATPSAAVAAASGTSSSWKPTPEQQAFFDSVAELEPKAQVEAVRKKLMEVNPRFDGEIHHVSGVKTLQVPAAEITAIWPVRGLTDLERLECSGGSNNKKAKFADIAALKGMPLSYLNLSFTSVSDLSPLKGMPLGTLNVSGTDISDLTPLAGLPLKSLSVSWTDVSDLTPLEGMRLSSININMTRVSDLAPLKGMPLQNLSCHGARIADLSPLKGMTLRALNLQLTQIWDISPLAGMPLTILSLGETRVADLSPLQGLPVEILELTPHVFDAQEEKLLRSLPLKRINRQSRTEFFQALDERRTACETFAAETANLAPEQRAGAVATRLKQLNDGHVGALGKLVEKDFIVGVTLVLHNAVNDRTTEVTPLQAFSHLKRLTLTGGPYFLDLSPIASLPLEELNCTDDIALRNLEQLRGMTSLKTINGQPAGEYLDKLVKEA
jgi:Leucine-rich repeat (LRR) protein